MNEIKNPEQKVDKSSENHSPEQMRGAEASKQAMGERLDNGFNKDLVGTNGSIDIKSSQSEATDKNDLSRQKQLEDGFDKKTESSGEAKTSAEQISKAEAPKPEKKIDKPTVEQSPEQLRSTEAKKQQMAENLDQGFSKGALETKTNLDKLTVVESRTAEEANGDWKVSGYDSPPYKPNTEVSVVVSNDEKFSRVYSHNDDGTSNRMGPWIMRSEDINGLSPGEIKDKYALPKTPTHVCDVDVPKDFKLQTGIANFVDGWGNGGGQQFDTMGKRLPPQSFYNDRLIDEKEK